MSPDTINAIIDLLLKTYIVCVMFAMGLTLTTSQIKEQVQRYGLMSKALLANIIIVPQPPRCCCNFPTSRMQSWSRW